MTGAAQKRGVAMAGLALLVIAGLVLLASAMRNGETYDERLHVNCGLVFWATGRPFPDPAAQPPLRAIYSMPAHLFRCPLPRAFVEPLPGEWRMAALVTARIAAVGLFLLWCWVFGRMAARWFGAGSGLAALILMLCGPTVTGHAQLATTDVLFTMTAISLVAVLYEWTRKPTWLKAIGLGAAGGLCLLSKYSALVWGLGVGLGLVLWTLPRFLHPWHEKGTNRTAKALQTPAAQLALACLIALAILAAPYRFEGAGAPLGTVTFRNKALASQAQTLSWFPSPFPTLFLQGLDFFLETRIRSGYFAGELKEEADWILYFPALLLMKPPLTLHALLLMALVAFVRKRTWRSPDFLLFAVPALFFFVYASVAPGFRIGVRHVLVVFPMLFLAAAWAVTAFPSRWWRCTGAALVVAFAIQGLSAAPHQLAYFNAIAGGPEGAWRWFADSNQDWGQCRPFIHDLMDREGLHLEFEPVEGKTVGWIALSTNMLVGLNEEDREKNRWIRERLERRRFVHPCWHLYEIPIDYWEKRPEKPETPEPDGGNPAEKRHGLRGESGALRM
ncbi:MAG TPA: hypothetical protein VM492_14450 [Sumerlaeia bacterium]|nr:hypothetical protein [Sumerlaeia bacterium]